MYTGYVYKKRCNMIISLILWDGMNSLQSSFNISKLLNFCKTTDSIFKHEKKCFIWFVLIQDQIGKEPLSDILLPVELNNKMKL